MRQSALLPLFLGAVTLLGVLAIGGIVIRNVEETRTLLQDTSLVSTTLEIQHQLNDILLRATEAETGQRGYVLTGDDSYLETYRTAITAMPSSIERLAALIADPRQTDRIRALRDAVQVKLTELARTIELRQSGGLRRAMTAVRTDEGQQAMDSIRGLVGAMEQQESAQLEERRTQAQAAYTRARRGRIGSGIVSGSLLIGVALLAILLGRVRERTAQQVADEREHLSVTLASIGDGVIATDVTGRVTLVNAVAETLVGLTQPGALGRPIQDIFRIVNENSRQVLENPITRVLKEGHAQGLANHTLLIAHDGVERPIDDSGAPIRGRDGAIRGAVLVFRDVAERRAQEAALVDSEARYREAARSAQIARKEAEEANRLKDEFLAVLSHELRTPLNAVLGWAQILQARGTPPATAARGLAAIKRNAEGQQRLVEDLLDVSRIVTGKLQIDRKPTAFRAVVASAVDAIGPEAAARGLKLFSKLDPTIVDADAYRLQQVASNLLSNAVKFTPHGGRVEITLFEHQREAVLVVSDTGQGIAPNLLPHMFDRFRQGDGSSTRSQGGLGLGLAIAKHIVEAHGGTISARSDGTGRGATFTVQLPAMDATTVTTSYRALREAFEGARLGSLRGLRALVVDDEADARELLSCALQEAGADVVVAADGTEALALLSAEPTHVLLTDMQMPGMDGFELLAAVRTRLRSGSPPAIAITARAGVDDVTRAHDAGFAAHLTKPVDLNLLVATIRRIADESSGSPSA